MDRSDGEATIDLHVEPATDIHRKSIGTGGGAESSSLAGALGSRAIRK